jgi:hypothetical protein
VQILGSTPLPPAFAGANGALIHYRFVLMPAAVPSEYLYVLPHPLQGSNQVMEASSIVMTLPPTPTPALNYWTFLLWDLEARPDLFQQYLRQYVEILSTLYYDPRVLAKYGLPPIPKEWMMRQIIAPLERFAQNDPTYRRSDQGLGDALGGNVVFEGSGGETGQVPIPEVPSYAQPVICSDGKTYLSENDAPLDVSCKPAPPRSHRPN